MVLERGFNRAHSSHLAGCLAHKRLPSAQGSMAERILQRESAMELIDAGFK